MARVLGRGSSGGCRRALSTGAGAAAEAVAKGATESAVVEINVGGQKFVTTRETLHQSPALREALASAGRTGLLKDGAVFIDRDPTHFPKILSFMRTGRILLPKESTALTELLWEAHYYQLKALEQKILRTSVVTRVLGDFAANPFEAAKTLVTRFRDFAAVATAIVATWTAIKAYTQNEMPKVIEKVNNMAKNAQSKITGGRTKSEDRAANAEAVAMATAQDTDLAPAPIVEKSGWW